MNADVCGAEVWCIDLDAVGFLLLDIDRAYGIVPEPWPDATDAVALRRRETHIGLRLLLARTCGRDVSRQPFDAGATGKPRLANGVPAFSLSHSGDRALIAITRDGEIGADIEAPRTPRMSERRQQQILTAGCDVAGGRMLSGGPDAARLLQAWVRLEAIAKMSGEGMARLLTRLGIVGGGDPTGVAPGGPWPFVRDLELDRGYHGAVAGSAAVMAAPLRSFPSDGAAILSLFRGGAA